MPVRKKRRGGGGGLRVLNFATFTDGSFSNGIMAVKGLMPKKSFYPSNMSPSGPSHVDSLFTDEEQIMVSS